MAFSKQILKDFIENTIAVVQRTGLKVLELQSRYVKLIIQGFGDDRLIRITPSWGTLCCEFDYVDSLPGKSPL